MNTHHNEQLDEVNKARFRRENGIVPPGRADSKRAVETDKRPMNKPGF